MLYPVEAVLAELLDNLVSQNNAVLIAPPGAGKTTIVAPAILQQPWCTGQVLLLSPRRIAARMAAERIAELCGEEAGQTIGYATRMDSKQSPQTRLLVLTEGIFRSRIIADPELTGVSAVIFDEVHERSLDSDFGLALALEAQEAFRPDIRILAMSATLDGDRFSALMNNAPVLRSEGKSWPLSVHYAGRRAEIPMEQDIARVIRVALQEQQGDILAFLPGVREIEHTAQSLQSLGGDIVIHILHGSVDPLQQRAALRRDPQGKRKIILATNIAETSLTIDDVRIVIDSGLARRARYDKAAGVTRLVTERASLSAATQRAGRAARQGPGAAYRLWEEAGNGGLPPFDPPEILECDLTPMLLDAALWGESDPARLRWLDPPPEASVNEARKALLALDAIDVDGRITAHGKSLAKLPLPPHLAHMVMKAGASGQGQRAATLALLMQERGLGGQGDDLEQRMDRFAIERGGRSDAARALTRRIGDMVPTCSNPPLSIGAMTALAFSGRVAKRRDAKGENWISVMGRGLRLDSSSTLTNADWLAVSDMQGAASGARIMSAAVITLQEIEQLFSNVIKVTNDITYDRAADRIAAKSIRKLGGIILSEGHANTPDPLAVADVLMQAICSIGIDMLPWCNAAISLRRRSVYACENMLSDDVLLRDAGEWLLPILTGITRVRDIPPGALLNAIETRLGWDVKTRIDRTAPPRFESPAGTSHAIDYAAIAGPTVELRVQALFGLDHHPIVGTHHIPLVLSLTSPAGRPIQTTRDLPAFWRGSWRDVAKEMRGRYPKHNWPDAPWEASASLKTKKAQMRD
jgi:ATP-dependent helicase HrpB